MMILIAVMMIVALCISSIDHRLVTKENYDYVPDLKSPHNSGCQVVTSCDNPASDTPVSSDESLLVIFVTDDHLI